MESPKVIMDGNEVGTDYLHHYNGKGHYISVSLRKEGSNEVQGVTMTLVSFLKVTYESFLKNSLHK